MPAQAMESVTSAQAMLKKMAESAHTLSYAGTATYEQSGVMRSVKVVHTVRDGLEVERLEYLDGPRHEVIRRGNPVDCQRVGDLLVKGQILPTSEQDHAHLEDYYHFSIRGDTRIAGRKVSQVFLEPKDRYRYGHLLSLDKKTGLLLQSMLISVQGKVLERFQFTSIDIGVVIDESALQPKVGKHIVARTGLLPCHYEEEADSVVAAMMLKSDDSGQIGGLPGGQESHWKAAWVPPGFVLADLWTDAVADRQEMMYTDGMSSFSVFIDPDETRQPADIEARRGATVAYLAKIREGEKLYTVCVVGELPMQTARLIAEAVKRPSGNTP